MQIKEIMTVHAEYLQPEATLREAAERMRDLDCGFLPIGNDSTDRLEGVITDRDITIRGVADGKDPNSTTVDEVETGKVLYCYAEDDVQDAARNMQEQQVYRLIVLNNKDEKRLCGVVSLGDIVRSGVNPSLAGNAARGIVDKAA